MRMNVFEMEGFLRGKCVPRDLKVNETNAEYLVRKFDALEAKCETLATENARLNKFIVQNCYVFNGEQDEISDAYICATDGGMPQIPATDAFLAEVRAQGVEMFSEKFGGGTPLSNMVKEVAADFAAKLRKGGE
ncbi:hypothetical protein DRW31_01840 [Shigella dysenteriae]|uniref:Uncharacterized protein n=2 Tax=Shigella TaxID=620 RepID=A0A1S9JFK2_SHIBO|nr:hypothetical protein [Escherichia coli]EGD7149934.1 hypothetical protein [Shigella dysenteriae]OOO81704.1 hypothetical protein AJR17_009875 [Shigella boydii]EGE2517295.1 hypothetical protein [Shigella dysenteriae]MBA8145056.1 hypothetical protein [Escherichia coli]